jgi:5-methylcytosine-specific restriction endonuclease McrBC GTP-binding regulatory subunit McrB
MVVKNVSHNKKLLTDVLTGCIMKKCPVCAVEVEDNAPFCNICGVNLSGAKDVGPSSVETPVSKESGTPKSTSAPPIIKSGKTSFYLPALQFLAAVALLGLVLYYTTADIPGPDAESKAAGMNGTSENLNAYVSDGNPLRCPDWINRNAANDPDGCPLVLTSSWETDNFNIKANQYQSVLGLIIFLGLCIFIQARRINDSNIMAPLIFCILIMVLIYAYIGGGYSPVNDDKICTTGNTDCISDLYPAEALSSVYSTLGATTALIVIIVSYIVFLYSVTGKDISEAPLSTIYSFVGAGSLVFAALHHNWVRGPWFNCSTLFDGSSDLDIFNACYAVDGTPTRSLVNLQPVEMIILLAGLLALLFGIAAYILQTIRLKDMEEAKYFLMILLGLGFQFFVLVWNLIRNRANLYFEQGDIILTVLFVSIAFLGIYLFYRKRKSEQSMEGLAYFGLFAVGIGTLFATMIAPALLSQKDISAPDDSIGWVMLVIPLLVAGGAVWYGIKFGTEKFRDRMMEMQLSSPPTSDPFDSSFEPEEESKSDEPSAPVSSGDISLEDAMDRLLSEFPEATIDIKPTEDENYGTDLSHLDDLEKDLKEELAATPKIRKAMKVDYNVDYEELSKYYSTTEDTINQTVTHLKSGRNIMLYGDPGTGKTALANLLLSQICGVNEAKDGSMVPNYSIVTANAEWSNFEVIGGISPDDSGGYYFKEGYVADAAQSCEKTMQDVGKPHYLVIDEFNRANIDEAFGKLFTVFEYRDKQALLTAKETGGAPFMMPPEFRIIGTMNTQDKNTLFNVGHALMRRFAFVEIGLPDRDDEYKRMPIFVFNKLNKLGIAPERPETEEDWYAKEMFDFYDEEGIMFKAFNKFMNFLEEEELPQSRDDELARGVRTYRKIGPAVIIDSMLTVFNSIGQYDLDRALGDVIKSNVMPALEGLERNELKCLMLKSQEVLGPTHSITVTLEKMVDSPGLSVFG